MAVTTKTVKSSGGDYSSLSGWEAGQQKVISAGDSEEAECYSFSDTTQLVIDGWTTAADAYIRIYAASGERHAGKWDSTKYRLETTATNNILENYVRFEGLQISLNSASTFRYALNLVGAANNGDGYLVDGCIVKLIGTTTDQYGIRLFGGSVESIVRNCIVYDFNSTGSVGISGVMASNTSRMDNNTAQNCTLGFTTGYLDTIIRNCLASGCTNGFTATGDWYTGSDYNASDLASDAPGANSRNSQTFTFVDAANDDFHLASSDTGALGFGIDLSGTFTTDIDGETRTGTWDIGADEYVAAGVAASLPPITRSFPPALLAM